MREKTKTIIYLIFFVIAIVGISVFLNYKSKMPKETITDTSLAETKRIIEISENDFEKEVLQSSKKVLVDFYATWCMPCRTIKPRVSEIANEHEEIKVVEIDVDKAPILSNKYGIVSIPTLVVFENGKEVNRVIGAVEKEKILEICGI